MSSIEHGTGPDRTGPSRRSVSVRAATHGRDRPADAARALRPERLDPLEQRPGEDRRVHDGGQQRADRPRQRVRRALERAVRVEQPRDPQLAAGRARGEQGERAVEQLAVRVEEDGDGMLRRARRPRCWRRPNPGLSPSTTTSAPGRPRERRAVVGRRRCRPRSAAAGRGAARARRAAPGAARRSRAGRRRWRRASRRLRQDGAGALGGLGPGERGDPGLAGRRAGGRGAPGRARARAARRRAPPRRPAARTARPRPAPRGTPGGRRRSRARRPRGPSTGGSPKPSSRDGSTTASAPA